MAKAKISEFLAWASAHAGEDQGREQIGYVMGATGQVGTEANIIGLSKSSYPQAWKKHYDNCKRWIGHVITDCNGVAEAFLNKVFPQVSHNTKAKYNYATWCAGHNGRDMGKMPQVPGTAVFCADALGVIYHVAYLYKKYGPGPRQWHLLNNGSETRGLVLTRLEDDRSFNRWGQMMLHFDYDTSPVPFVVIPKTIKIKAKGDVVKTLQTALNAHGAAPRLSVDGSFGPLTDAAVRAFQKKNKLEVDGVVGPITWGALLG